MLNKINFYINKVFDKYLSKGIKLEDLLEYLNTDESNYTEFYSKCYKELSKNNIIFESKDLKQELKENITDKIRLLEDLKSI